MANYAPAPMGAEPVLPKGFHRARYFGFLHANCMRLIGLLHLLLRFGPGRFALPMKVWPPMLHSVRAWPLCYGASGDQRLRPSNCPTLMGDKSTPSKQRALIATM